MCAAVGGVRLEHTITGKSVELSWSCHHCEHAWPISAEDRELTDRRKAAPERRRVVRKDRRQKR
jgi:hypothetical protein